MGAAADVTRTNSTASSNSSNSSDTKKGLKLKKLKGIENANFTDDDSKPRSLSVALDKDLKLVEEAGIPAAEPVEDDPWKIVDVLDSGPPWKDLTGRQKAKAIAINTTKILCLVILLYFFVCSLDILSSSFRLIAGLTAGEIFQNSELLQNPVAGLMLGVLATVILQSSSTSTSIIVAMVGSNILSVESATFIIMGANIGTSVTSTIVAMTQVGDREVFRRAFAGGTVHDMFNWLTVLILLPLEYASKYLVRLTDAITDSLNRGNANETSDVQFLQAITRPLTNLIIQVDEDAIEAHALNKSSNDAAITLVQSGNHIFNGTTLSDTGVGLILLFGALIVIIASLILLVKILSSMLKGAVANVIKKVINFDFDFPFGFLTGYIALAVGAGFTFIVQSSSVFTSILTPLVGVGVISIERMYPLTLGSNIGTTTTSVLAAFAAPALTFHLAMQTALIHLFFNLSGVILWYPVPFMRNIPISGAKVLGNTTAKYRWFAIVYVLLVFLLIPGFVFALSVAGTWYLVGIGGPLLLLAIVVIVVSVLQRKVPKVLPPVFRSWDFLPEPLHSLDPMDRVMRKFLGLFPCCRKMLAEGDSPVAVTILPHSTDPTPPSYTVIVKE